MTITTKNRGDSHSFGNYSVHFPSNRGIATPVCALVRNDSVYMARTFKHQFTEQLSKADMHNILYHITIFFYKIFRAISFRLPGKMPQ